MSNNVNQEYEDAEDEEKINEYTTNKQETENDINQDNTGTETNTESNEKNIVDEFELAKVNSVTDDKDNKDNKEEKVENVEKVEKLEKSGLEDDSTRIIDTKNLGVISDLKPGKSHLSNQENLEKVYEYIKITSKDERISILNDESAMNMSLDLQECDLGQELLNELYNTRISSEHEPEIEGSQRFSQHQPHRYLLNDKESISSSDRAASRIDIITKLKDLLIERKATLDTNRDYQSKLVEYFKFVKAKQKVSSKPISEKDFVIDFNTQYDRYTEILQVLMVELSSETSKYQEKIDKLQANSETKTKQNNVADKDFFRYQENIGLTALHSRTGFKLDLDVIKDFFVAESKKEAIIKIERLNNLKLEHKNARIDKALRSKENFEGGLRLIDFEQLKIENQTFNEKVEERREAINKLNRKISNCNHLLSHIKEKISFTDHDKRTSIQKLVLLNKDFKRLQKISNKSKKVRDYIKTNNRTLQMQCGLLGKKDYLRKYEECFSNVQKMRDSIVALEFTIHHLTNESNDLTNKIKESKQ